MKKEIRRVSVFQKKVYEVVKKIPRGQVTTYTVVARAIDNPCAARAVGNALNKNRFHNVPCHRVVQSSGFVGGYAWGSKKKVRILKSEGIEIIKDFVNFQQIVRNL